MIGEKPIVCPKCHGEKGLGGYIQIRTVKGRKYKYWVHQNYVNGKRVVSYCYLGPVEAQPKEKAKVEEEMEVELLEVFKDIQLRYTARSSKEEGKPSYTREYEIIPKPNFEPITLDKLKAYAEKLNQQIPTFKFYVEEVNVKGKKLVVIRRSDKPIDVEKLEGEIQNLKTEIEIQRRLLPHLEEELKEAQNEYKKVKAQFENKAKILEDLTKTNIIKRLFNYFKIKNLQREIAYINQLLNFLNERVKKAEEKVEAQKVMIREIEEKLKTSTEELGKVKEKLKVKGKPWLPIYFDLENQKVYVEKPLWEKESKLYSYALHRCLGWLGIVTTRHVGYVH